MVFDQTVEAPAEAAQGFDVLTQLRVLQSRVLSAESAAANLERALDSNRRIGIAIGILMCQHRITDAQAIALLKTHSQDRHIKVRELAETVILTGAL